jgi:ribosome-associated toxin RatA of RatAB toxin-antitoxin module
MKKIHKSVLIWFSPQEMFDLVSDVAQYPAFLPWCSHARVLERTADGMQAEVGMAWAGVKQSFVTQNTHVAPHSIEVRLVRGPFSKLEGHWLFKPIGDGSQRACRIEFTLSYGFSSGVLASLVGPVFDKVAASLVDAFVKRAEQVYDSPTAAPGAPHPGA